MGEKANAKKQRRERRRRRAGLEEKLRQQHELLQLFGELFDGGHPVVALHLATVIRVLVHESRTSHALLGQLELIDTLKFVDTAVHINPRNLLTNPGLVVTKQTTGRGAEWAAPLGMPLPPRQHPPASFETWWRTPVVKDESDRTWPREKFVLHLAHSEGGGHVDPREPDEWLRALEEDNTLGWMAVDPITGEGPMLNGPILPSVRQIAYELEQTIAPVVGGIVIEAEPDPPR